MPSFGRMVIRKCSSLSWPSGKTMLSPFARFSSEISDHISSTVRKDDEVTSPVREWVCAPSVPSRRDACSDQVADSNRCHCAIRNGCGAVALNFIPLSLGLRSICKQDKRQPQS